MREYLYKIEINTSEELLQKVKDAIERYITISKPIKYEIIDKGVILIFNESIQDNIIKFTNRFAKITFNVSYSILDNNVVYQSGELSIKNGIIISIWEAMEYSKSAIDWAYEIDKNYILNKNT